MAQLATTLLCHTHGFDCLPWHTHSKTLQTHQFATNHGVYLEMILRSVKCQHTLFDI